MGMHACARGDAASARGVEGGLLHFQTALLRDIIGVKSDLDGETEKLRCWSSRRTRDRDL